MSTSRHHTPASPAATPRLKPPPWYARLILALQRRKYGTELESAMLWARLPRAFLALTLHYRSLDRRGSPLEPGLRALVQVRVSQINWWAFCVDLNGAAALERAVAPDKLAALPDYARSGLYSDREKAALAYAEAVTDSTRHVDEPMRQALRSHFGEQVIIELTALIAFQNMSSKFNAALGVPSQGFCAPPSSPPDGEHR